MGLMVDHEIRRAICEGEMLWEAPEWLAGCVEYDMLDAIQPSSLDFLLGDQLSVPHYNAVAILEAYGPLFRGFDHEHPIPKGCYRDIDLLERGYYILRPGEFVLGHIAHRLGLSRRITGSVAARSKWGRMAAVVCADAGHIDPGFDGHVTLEISNRGPLPIRLTAGAPMGQLIFQKHRPCEVPYGDERRRSTFQHQRRTTPYSSLPQAKDAP